MSGEAWTMWGFFLMVMVLSLALRSVITERDKLRRENEHLRTELRRARSFTEKIG